MQDVAYDDGKMSAMHGVGRGSSTGLQIRDSWCECDAA